jgi:DNA-binding MarR family transcriptional regulator
MCNYFQIDLSVKPGENKIMSGDGKNSREKSTTARRAFGNYAIRLGELVFARAENALAPLDLTPLAYETMTCIADGQGRSQQDLGRRLGIYAPKMVGILDGLQNRGLVERRVSATDRRRHELLLTPKAHALLRRAIAVGAALEEELFGCVPIADKARFAALVERLESAALPRDA